MTAAANPLNFIKLTDPYSLQLSTGFAKPDQTPFGVFVTGYSAAPKGYSRVTKKYEKGLVDSLRAGGKAPVLVTSPTVTKDSIDAICTTVAHETKSDVLYVTAKDYLEYVDPAELPKTASRRRFKAEPKFYFEDKRAYSLASAAVSDVTEVTGGRDTAVLDFMNAFKENKTIILVDNRRLPEGFDTAKQRPLNAEEYIERMIRAEAAGEELPYPAVNGLDAAFIDANLEGIKERVKVDDIDHPRYLASPSILAQVPIKKTRPAYRRTLAH